MAVLARDSPFKTRLGLGAWLQQLLFFAADAAAARDWPLAARALDGFSAAVAAGGERLAGDLARCNVLPLAAQLWGTGDEVLRRSLMTVVAAVARIGEGKAYTEALSQSSQNPQRLTSSFSPRLTRRCVHIWPEPAKTVSFGCCGLYIPGHRGSCMVSVCKKWNLLSSATESLQ